MLKRLSIFSILVISVQLIAAQLISPYAAFKRYTSEDGLSQQVVRSIVQDQEGFIWIGTEDGLNKFDGYEFKQYRNIRNDQSSLPDNFIYALCPSADGSLWIGTNSSGIARFDPVSNSFKNWPSDPANPNSLKANRIYTSTKTVKGYYGLEPMMVVCLALTLKVRSLQTILPMENSKAWPLTWLQEYSVATMIPYGSEPAMHCRYYTQSINTQCIRGNQ